jgi:sugar phosphate isomerase/epimerase
MRRPLLSLAPLTIVDADPVRLLECAAAAGFDAVGLRILPPLPTDTIVPVIGEPSLQRRIREKLRDTGLSVLDVEAVWLMPHVVVAELLPALDLAAELGARYVLTVGHDPNWHRLCDNFSGLCAAAQTRGLRVMLEFIPYAECASLAEAHRLLLSAPPGSAGLLVDALHLSGSHGRSEDLNNYDPRLFSYIHLCDAPKRAPPPAALRHEARAGRLYPGAGALWLQDFLAAFPVNTPIAVEAPNSALNHLPAQQRAALAMAATRRLLDAG